MSLAICRYVYTWYWLKGEKTEDEEIMKGKKIESVITSRLEFVCGY